MLRVDAVLPHFPLTPASTHNGTPSTRVLLNLQAMPKRLDAMGTTRLPRIPFETHRHGPPIILWQRLGGNRDEEVRPSFDPGRELALGPRGPGGRRLPSRLRRRGVRREDLWLRNLLCAARNIAPADRRPSSRPAKRNVARKGSPSESAIRCAGISATCIPVTISVPHARRAAPHGGRCAAMPAVPAPTRPQAPMPPAADRLPGPLGPAAGQRPRRLPSTAPPSRVGHGHGAHACGVEPPRVP